MNIARNAYVVLVAFVIALALVAFANAQESTVTFPVAELGGCESKGACKAYCDEPGHFKACFAFAKAHDLLPEEDRDRSEEEIEKFAQIMQKGGPGGCTSHESCEAYCSEARNM